MIKSERVTPRNRTVLHATLRTRGISVWLLIDILCARTTDQELLKLKRCVPVLRPPLLFRCGVQGRMWLRLYKLSQAPVVIILYIKKKRETERARARQRWYDQRRRVSRWWGRPSGWVHACVQESLAQTYSGGCMLTQLKVLEFFSGLEFFRTCARSQGSAAKKEPYSKRQRQVDFRLRART